MIDDLDKNKLDELFSNASDPNLLFEADDSDYDTNGAHNHHHNHDNLLNYPEASPPPAKTSQE